MGQGEIAGQVCVDVGQRFLHSRGIMLSSMSVHQAAISLDHISDQRVGLVEAGCCFNATGVLTGHSVQIQRMHPALLSCLAQQGVADDTVVFHVAQRIGGSALIVQP